MDSSISLVQDDFRRVALPQDYHQEFNPLNFRNNILEQQLEPLDAFGKTPLRKVRMSGQMGEIPNNDASN